MDKDRNFSLPEEPKRVIKESVGVEPHEPDPEIRRGDARGFAGGARLGVGAINNGWRWPRDEHRQR
jgi:hypothetical protein